jgi:hypothetical protein
MLRDAGDGVWVSNATLFGFTPLANGVVGRVVVFSAGFKAETGIGGGEIPLVLRFDRGCRSAWITGT